MKYWNDRVIYDYCANVIKVIYMETKKEYGKEYTAFCGYTGKEYHQIYLGEL